jgi:cold shock protein
MSRLEDRIDVMAEIDACERIWGLNESRLDLELVRAGVDPNGLVQRLEASIGLTTRPVGSAGEMRRRTEEMAKTGTATGGLQVQMAAGLSAAPIPASSPPLEIFELAGRIKFFDATKGFGFFVADDGRGDVMVHVSRLQAAGVRTVYEGTRIHAVVHLTPKGLQVLQILSVNQSEAVHPSQIEPRTREKVQPESDWVRAVVKWYNTAQGYGFVCEGRNSPDCFIHADTLRRWGMGPLIPGQIVEIRWGTAPRGRMVAEIRHPDGASALPPVH